MWIGWMLSGCIRSKVVIQAQWVLFVLRSRLWERLIIIGCGPKAIAIAAKAHVLNKLGWRVPEIVIIEKSHPAANWDGTHGYTDGDTILGTTPLEDVGFPLL